MKSVGVVGGGIIGLATAEAILEDLKDVSITIYSSEFSPNTTADVSAGWIFPYLTGEDENVEDLACWTKSTIDHLVKVSEEGGDIATAICPLSGYMLYKNGPVKISYCIDECFPGSRLVSQTEIARLTKNKYAGAVFLTTWFCDCSIYLPYMMRKLEKMGVKFVKEKILSLDDVAERGHDVVLNCAGNNSKFLTNDASAHPIRGQVIVARAPWIKHFLLEEDGDTYILPRKDTVVVGGTHTADDSTAIDHETSKTLWKDACNMHAKLREATVLKDAAGIRPGRTKIRMEVEEARTTSGKKYVVFHHYGHGGSGVTLHWGCAKHVSGVLKQFLANRRSLL